MDPERPEYPTDQQIEELFAAYEKYGNQGVMEFLRKQDRQREAAEEKVGA